MAAHSEDDNAQLISNEEVTGPELPEEAKIPEGDINQYQASTDKLTTGRFERLGRWAKVLFKWWRTLVILLTPLFLLLLFAIAEDTRVSIDYIEPVISIESMFIVWVNWYYSHYTW